MLSKILIATDLSEASDRVLDCVKGLSAVGSREALVGEEGGGERCRAACVDFFRHILLPTDFSETAERAFQYLHHVVREARTFV